MRRKKFVEFMTAVASGGTLFGNTVLLMVQEDGRVTRQMMFKAEALAGVKFTKAQRELMMPVVQSCIENIQKIREISIPLEIAPPFYHVSDAKGIWSLTPKKIMEG
jgi:hypothetical protein